MSNSAGVIITGAASGIGRHLTGVFIKKGYRVMATDINIGALTEISAKEWDGAGVMVEKLDVRRPDQWQAVMDRAVREWGQIDILLNSAGYCIPCFIYENTLEQIDIHIDINAKGAIYGTYLASVQMVKQGFGHIINIGSLSGIAPVPGNSLYSGSKFALRGFTHSIASELRRHNVYVTYIAPDLVDTPKLLTMLKVDENAAAIGSSAPRILTVYDIEKAVFGKVLKRRPLEVAIPEYRGWLGKIATVFPAMASFILASVAKTGLENIKKEKVRREKEIQADTPDFLVAKGKV